MILALLYDTLFVFLFNLPFGYWRINVKKFSFQWVLAVHIPVPFIIALRIYTTVGFAWYTYIFMVAAFFLGQKMGALIHYYMERICQKITSCLFIDIIRCSRG